MASWGSPVERLKAGADSTGGAAGAAANSGSGGRAGSAGTGPLTAARGGLGGLTPWCMKVKLVTPLLKACGMMAVCLTLENHSHSTL